MIAATVSQQYRCLVEILTCLVCKGIVQQAHICPNCSKFYCLHCIHQQLATEQKCLNCNRFLNSEMLSNCEKLCSDLAETLQRVKLRGLESKRGHHDKSPYYCYRHKLQKTYYCQTCNVPLCSDCSVLTDTHRGHQFIKLSLMKTQYKDKMTQKKSQINAEVQSLTTQIESLSQGCENKQSIENETLVKVQSSMKSLRDDLRKKLKKLLKQGQRKLNSYNESLEEWNQTYERDMKTLKRTSQGKFVQSEFSRLESHLIKVINEACAVEKDILHTRDEIKKKNVPINYIYPEYETFTFLINEFSRKKQQGEVIYTESVTTKEGLQFRLKIYPNGISSQQPHPSNHPTLTKKHSKNQQYLAVFIELVDGPTIKTKQRHQIMLNSLREGTRPFLREFQNEFDVGLCWGYEHFMRLSQLYEQGFYSRESDSVEVCLRIAPQSYCQASRDQLGLIAVRENILRSKRQHLQDLQRLLQKEARSTSSSLQIDLISS